ncbi:MAG: lipoyl(octanoyl) transferase LipB [Desulfobacter sp.]|nr:MAG: lipoyl(octanoyl) transferase LipB [Desulfobacter sp.]
MTVSNSQRSCEFNALGVLEYTGALALQQDILSDKLADRDTPDRLLFVEHPPVYTLGRRGGRENLVVAESFLEDKGITIVQTDRGGNITYHGPGQAVLYPVVDLEKNKISVPDFVYGMEEIMKRTCQDFGVAADRDDRNHGLWVGDRKIGSVGIALKKGISIHGLALNVNPDLSPFSWINPCGLANQSMTSIAVEKNTSSLTLGAAGDEADLKTMESVCQCFIRHFCDIFNFELIRENNHVMSS